MRYSIQDHAFYWRKLWKNWSLTTQGGQVFKYNTASQSEIEQTFHRKVFNKISEIEFILNKAYFDLSRRGASSESKVNQNGQKRKTKNEADWIGEKWQSWFRTISRKYSAEDFSNSTKWRNDF